MVAATNAVAGIAKVPGEVPGRPLLFAANLLRNALWEAKRWPGWRDSEGGTKIRNKIFE